MPFFTTNWYGHNSAATTVKLEGKSAQHRIYYQDEQGAIHETIVSDTIIVPAQKVRHHSPIAALTWMVGEAEQVRYDFVVFT